MANIINPLLVQCSKEKENKSLMLEEFGTDNVARDLSVACLVDGYGRWMGDRRARVASRRREYGAG